MALAATKKGKEGGDSATPTFDASFEAQRLFLDGKKSVLAPNVWYESPDTTTSTKKRVWQFWQTRPTRTIDRISDGRTSVGCTWTQLDGRRGVSYLRFNDDGKLTYVREIPEPTGFNAKFSGNAMASMKTAMGVVGALRGSLNFLDQYLRVFDPDDGPKQPKLGIAKPKSRSATSVVKYLWEEAQYDEDYPVDRIMAEYSEDAVYEDMTCKDEVWAKGKDAVRTYMEETRANQPESLNFVLDELSDGSRACVATWHVEFAGQNSPRGVTYYEVDAEGKVCYARASYDVNF